jgi:hypothetical protein
VAAVLSTICSNQQQSALSFDLLARYAATPVSIVCEQRFEALRDTGKVSDFDSHDIYRMRLL